ncbi:MAG: phosphoenolpyruvate--protein phosphotransferase [Rhodobacteraceae bacterium]|nr:phosphoenolpyruvate--protein phosphotransferase [Paracoccaceae bacterium]
MNNQTLEISSQELLLRLNDTLASQGDGQERLNQITEIVSQSMGVDVCSIYLHRDPKTLELCATKGLNPEAVHVTRLRVSEGLVGKVSRLSEPVNSADAPSEKGFRYMAETGEERYSSFLGVPIQRLGQMLGVLVVQTKESRSFLNSEVNTLAVVATVLAEMRETGIITGEGKALSALHTQPVTYNGLVAHDGFAEGRVLLHEPRVVITNPVSANPKKELARLKNAIAELRGTVDYLLESQMQHTLSIEQREILETYRMFANSSGWLTRMEGNIATGLSAEASVEKEQSEARARMEKSPDPYLRDRFHDLDDLFNRLLRILTGQGRSIKDDMPENPILIARNIGPGELLEYGKNLKGIVLEEGSVGSHATIIARAMAIPLMIHVKGITTEALNDDVIFIDSENQSVHLRPDEVVASAIHNRIEMAESVKATYAKIRNLPALTRDGKNIGLYINAGLMAELPNLERSGAEGVGLFRTELRFLNSSNIPTREDLAKQYSQVLDSAGGKRVIFRTVDIGSDKMVPYMKREEEPNPAMGWRAIRISLDKPGFLRMQCQALFNGAKGRPLNIMFPMVSSYDEFTQAKNICLKQLERFKKLGKVIPESLEIGAMLETPSLAFAPDDFYKSTDFISIGGNDLKQFFFAADRQNEKVRSRYHALYLSYLHFIEYICNRCKENKTKVSYCGEDAGNPEIAICLAAMGVESFSIRSASLGRVKHYLRQVDLKEIKGLIDTARSEGQTTFKEGIKQVMGRCESSVT